MLEATTRLFTDSAVVLFENGEGAASLLEGLTLTGSLGSGVSCVGSSPSLENCVMTANYERGVQCLSSSPTITNCTISGSVGDSGVNCRDRSSPTITNCTIWGNSAVGSGGGGVYCNDSSPTITNCIISGNDATRGSGGGGVQCIRNSSLTLINCTISGNSAGKGGGVYCKDSSLTLTNCILWDGGNEIFDFYNSNSTTMINHSNIEGGFPGDGNFDTDPLFADLGYYDENGTPADANDDYWVDGDYHLKSQAGRFDPNTQTWIVDDVTSPCIDAGDPNSPTAFEAFPNGGIINMGAYGGTAEASKSPSGLHAKYGGGTGEPNDPYLIYTAEQMNAIGADANDWDKDFKLMADIDLAGYTGTDFNIIGTLYGPIFRGVFDGNGHTISNFSYTSTDTNYIGLFGYVEGGTIKDLGLIDPNVNAGTGKDVGSLVGDLQGGTINNCYAEGANVAGHNYVGGLVGSNEGTISITNCYSAGSVSGNSHVGGLVGWNDMGVGTITDCYASGDVLGNDEVGGLVGCNYGDRTITNCYSTADVGGLKSVGGLVGRIYNTINNCYSVGSVTGIQYVGGLVGRNYNTINNCYSVGSVSGDWLVGGLVGDNRYGSITSSFWDVEASGQSSSAGGTGLATAEMQDINTFLTEGWDFVDEILNGTCDYWQISPGDYPRLRYPVMPEGLGTAEEPYLIRDARDLGTVWFKPLAHYRLEASVDLSGITWSMAVIPQFWGGFDGNSYVISNLHIQGRGYLGLFGKLGSTAKISNLGLEAVDVNGIGRYVGGLAGWNEGSIATSYSTGTVTGNRTVGGLVGYNHWDGSITTSYSTGTVTGIDYVGGLVGSNGGSITASYSTGTVTGIDYVGGLVGLNDGSITTSYSTGSVTGIDYVGGFLGDSRYPHASITSSFWDTEASGLLNMCGRQDDDATGCDDSYGKTTAKMQMASTFLEASWDFIDETANGTENIWWILEGQDYPRLWWEVAEQ